MTDIQVLYDGPIVKRAEAKGAGLKRYFSGKACPHNHLSERFTSNGRCVECAYIQRDKFRSENPSYESERYERDKDRILKVNRDWARRNPVKGRLKTMRYNARKLSAEGYSAEKDIEEILSRQNYKCANCNSDFNGLYEVDHIMPLFLGGSNWPSNLQCLCRSCNARKSAKHPIDWARENGRLL